MGIQAVFSREEAVAYGAEVTDDTFKLEVRQTFDETDEQGMPWPSFRKVFTSNYSQDGDVVCIDFNHWGQIRPVVQPWLEANNIDYREV